MQNPFNLCSTQWGNTLYNTLFTIVELVCTAIPDCPRENDSTFWQIEWNTTKAGDTAKQNCPDSSEHYGKISMGKPEGMKTEVIIVSFLKVVYTLSI